jgi:NAD(P)H-flavin reductase/ferredoxin
MALLQKHGARLAQINDELVTVEPGETLLQAALRSGIDFPSSCRVGGCGTCKCQLKRGKVRELTETGYLLTAEEIDAGYVLACQSVPETDVHVDVALADRLAGAVAGTIVEQARLTHDITRITVQLGVPYTYKAGQFANLSLDTLAGVTRSYSFGAPRRDDGKVEFCIRKVPGGKLSTLVAEHELAGTSVRVSPPQGDFWLRPGDAPLLMVAGGSGLPPILAMLEDAAVRGVSRPVTLLFGARTQRDLYDLERIEALRQRWAGELRFVPVLSDATADGAWTGARGLVTDKIAELLQADSSAYLCGPPAMIDAARGLLESLGVARRHIYFDRFTTLADSASELREASSLPARLVDALHYLKYFSFHAVGLFAAAAIIAGGELVTAGLLTVLTLYMLGDAIAGDDTSTPTFRHPAILTVQLWLALPLLALIVFASVWSVCPGDPLGFGALVFELTGYDALLAREATTWGHHVSAWLITGLMIGMVGTIPAHELTHRTWDRTSMFVGRWLLAFSFDTSFAIEHVYGHHRYVATREDPATAPRGRSVYFHVLASTLKGNVSAWHIERDRLAKRRLGLFSHHNAFLRGHAMSVLLVLLAHAMGGVQASLYFVACALWGKALLEIVNYMEHYGIVRDPATPVQPRHSWNTNRRVSSWTMFNLTRHSHHHAQGEVPYHALRPYPDAPMMINGYLTTIVLTLIPPLWHRLMTPRVMAWDRDFATPEETLLAARANVESGIWPAQPRDECVRIR